MKLPRCLRAATVQEQAQAYLAEHQRARLHALIQVENARVYLQKVELTVAYHTAVIKTLNQETSGAHYHTYSAGAL